MATPLLTDYTYKKKISYPTSSVTISATVSNFPVCVHINSSSWSTSDERTAFANDNTDGKRVNFYAYDGTTRLPYEVEYYNGSTEAVYWVKVPSIVHNSDTNNYFWIGYGNKPEDADQSQATSVWDSNFKGVWHLGDNQWGSSPEAKDSTSNANHGTNSGSTDATGQVRKGRDFDGTADYIALGTGIVPTNMTASAFIKKDSNSGYDMIFSDCNSDSTIYCQPLLSNNAKLQYWWGSSSGNHRGYSTNNDVLNTTNTFHVATTQSGVNAPVFYVGGAAVASELISSAGTDNKPNIQGSAIGRSSPTRAFNYFDGWIDELRISDTARSADWIKLEYYSMLKTNWNGDSWLTWGSQEVNPTPSSSPSSSPSHTPSVSPSGSPSASPSPSSSESASPSSSPSVSPSGSPSVSPSSSPSASPSPSSSPSDSPSSSPSVSLSSSPSASPSPSSSESASPSSTPSVSPSGSPSVSPSSSPSVSESASPSASPSDSPSTSPSASPSASPSDSPSASPSASPSPSGTQDGETSIAFSQSGECICSGLATGTCEIDVDTTAAGFSGIVATGETEIEFTTYGVAGVAFTTELEFTQSGAGINGRVASGSVATIEISSEGVCFGTNIGTGKSRIEIDSDGAGGFTVIGTGESVLNIITEGNGINGIIAAGEAKISVSTSGDGTLTLMTISGTGTCTIGLVSDSNAAAGLASSGISSIELDIDSSGINGIAGEGTSYIAFTSESISNIVIIATDYYCIAVNTQTGAVSEYTNYDFNSFCEFNGQVLGCRSDGIYELTGTDDDGDEIDAHVQWGFIDPNIPAKSVIDRGFLSGEAAGDISVKTICDEDEYSEDVLHHMTSRRDHPVKIAKGLRGRLYEIQISNVGGSDFALHLYRLLTYELKKNR